VVGVNRHTSGQTDGPSAAIPTLKIDAAPEREQVARVQAVRARRDPTAASAALELVRRACESDSNVLQAVLEAARHDATLGEICQVFRQVFGEYRDPAHV
jgi:methylmalonyl-CoA mutase N-terminal domain/subunit